MNMRQIRRRAYPKGKGPKNIYNRCKTFDPFCLSCQSYAFKDQYGRFPYSFDEAYAYMQQQTKDMTP